MPAAKLIFTVAERIRLLHKAGALQFDLAKEFGVSKSSIWRICQRITYKEPEIALLTEKLHKHILNDPKTGCWNWTGATQKSYPKYVLSSKAVSPQRLLFEDSYGSINPNVQLRRRCLNRLCCNPEHMTKQIISRNTYISSTESVPSSKLKNNRTKLTFTEVQSARERLKSNTVTEVAREFSVSTSLMSNIKNDKVRLSSTKGIKERLLNKIKIDDSTGCWRWQGAKNEQGYGIIRMENKNRYVHRIAYDLYKGTVGGDEVIMHQCNTTDCCNPAHLVAGSQKENMAYSSMLGRTLHGENSPSSKLTEQNVSWIRRNFKEGSATDFARKFNVTPQMIWRIIKRKAWARI